MKKVLVLPLLVALGMTACVSTENTDSSETDMTTNAPEAPPEWEDPVWAGMYRGTLPCADCEGILTKIVLDQDLTYQKTMQYLGKEDTVFRQSGSFVWNDAEDEVTLKSEEEPNRYLLNDEKLIQLDADGNPIEGELAENYQLKKVLYDPTIKEKYWKLIELNGQPVMMGEDQEREAHFTLRQDNRVTGYSGCNALSGTYHLEEGYRIQFTDLAVSMRICPESEKEREFLDVLNTTDNYSHTGDTLTLNKARMAPLAMFEAVYFN